ncbi:helix-turn-helix domain-containing protein [Brevibacillus laterosporus]|uniref:helix-turn-helix domain-containing protein n=1 Tax=Brevibacillus laterosporus TaxID=1465 RepID=UPI002E1EDFBA|nr:helix-turn-helix domain-containing protein [Brevibacillus laterosporus]MED1670321.1 helix-turn-helix domain-containing protein [Brevibacillus laterosporus]MED1717884.1 helix-turn-helix domain-containing protein [Brevibacillus laterosporus]
MEVISNKGWHYTIIENEILDDTDHFEKSVDKLVYVSLCRFANMGDRRAHPSISRLAKMCGCSENFVRQSLKRLVSLGLIQIQERKEGSLNATNLYYLLPIPWGTSHGAGGTSPHEGGVLHTVQGGTSPREGELKTINKRHKELKYTSDFEKFFNAYPRQVEKKKAFSVWIHQEKKYGSEYLIKCAKNYADYCRASNTEESYIKHPSSFLSKRYEPFKEYENHCPVVSNRKENQNAGSLSADRAEQYRKAGLK